MRVPFFLIRGRGWSGFYAAGFLCDLHTYRRADPGGTGLEHRPGIVDSLHSTRSLHAKGGSDSPTHQSNVIDSSSSFRKPGRSFYEIGTRILRGKTRSNLFF